MADYNSQNLSQATVSGLQSINSTLQPIEKREIQKPVFKNTVSNQKDVTIDLSVFLDSEERNRFFNTSDDNQINSGENNV